MSASSSPFVGPDGSHVFPVTNLRQEMNCEQEATGEIRWSARDGLTFEFEFVGMSSMSWRQPLKKTGSGVGSHNSVPSLPDWSGRLADGTEACLYGATENHTTQQTSGTRGSSYKRMISGRAVYASVSLGKESELALWFDTQPTNRLYFLGLDMFAWPSTEIIDYSVGDLQNRRARASLALSSSPNLTIFCGSQRRGSPAWLAYKASDETPLLSYDEACEDVRVFLSFLVGRRTLFFWKDEFTSAESLSRVYFGSHRQKSEPSGSEQPVPLITTPEALQHGEDVISQLPVLFANFKELRASYDVEAIVSPLWYAYDGFLEDQLTLACVSLERLAAEHDDVRRMNASPLGKPLLTGGQSQALREALKPALRSVGSEHHFSPDAMSILERRIDNLHQPSNAEKLTNTFRDLGIVLTDAEKDVINNRNRCLHGRTGLTDAADVHAVDDEVRRFDTLRSLINRGVLSLMSYNGPYIDYSERPAKGNFPVKTMSSPTSDGPLAGSK